MAKRGKKKRFVENSEKKEFIRFSSEMSRFSSEGISYFIFSEHNGKINSISNMDDWKLKALREFINDRAWEIERKKLKEE